MIAKLRLTQRYLHLKMFANIVFSRSQIVKAKQKTFEFSFQVGKLQASLSKTDSTGAEALLAQCILDHFTLDFSLAKYEMAVDLMLR